MQFNQITENITDRFNIGKCYPVKCRINQFSFQFSNFFIIYVELTDINIRECSFV